MYRKDENRWKIMIYLAFFFFPMSAGTTEIPCTFPGPWIGQTFNLVLEWGEVIGIWTFHTDCQTSILKFYTDPSTTWLCHQITERFLVIRLQGSDQFLCLPIFYNFEDAPFKFTMGLDSSKRFANQTGEFTDICEVCFYTTGTYIAEVKGSPASAAPPRSCDIPSVCSTFGRVCGSNDTIQKGSRCDTTTTSPEPTTKPTTTTPGHHGRCRKRHHRHP